MDDGTEVLGDGAAGLGNDIRGEAPRGGSAPVRTPELWTHGDFYVTAAPQCTSASKSFCPLLHEVPEGKRKGLTLAPSGGLHQVHRVARGGCLQGRTHAGDATATGWKRVMLRLPIPYP